LSYSLDVNSRRLGGLRIGSQNDRDAGSLKAAYEFGDHTRVTVRLEQLQETIETRGDLSEEQINTDRRQAGSLNSATDLKQDSASLSIRHSLATGELNAVIVQRDKSTIGLSRFRGPQDESDDAININANYRHDLEKGSLIIGIDTYRGDVNTKAFGRRDTQLQGPFRKFNTQLDINAYFAQTQLELLNKLTLTAGLRYEDIVLSSDTEGEQQAKFSDLAPKLGLNYKLSDNNQIWASVSDGFYAPGLDDLFDADNGNPALSPEDAQNIEFGIRGTWSNWAYDTSAYQNKIQNYLVTQEFINADGDEFELTTNSGQVTVTGLESVIEYAPDNAKWRMGFTHTYANNKFDSFVQSTPDAADDFSGNQLGRSPKHHLNARLAWEPITNITAELEGDFYSSYFSDDANSAAGKFSRDERLNLRMTYQKDRWRVWLNVLNFSDTLEDRATFRRGSLRFRTIDGRSYYAGMSYKF
jgi:outer membrane receptor protein involved in Fe transport